MNGECRSLSHGQKTRLAVAFANCHLAKLGKRTYACTERMSLQQCVDNDDIEFFIGTLFGIDDSISGEFVHVSI